MLSDNRCANCHQLIAGDEQIVNADGHIWHIQCFVSVFSSFDRLIQLFPLYSCAQCFQPFANGIYFEVKINGEIIIRCVLGFSMKIESIVKKIFKCYLHLVVLNAVSIVKKNST